MLEEGGQIVDTGLIYELALGEGDQYAAMFAAILNGAQAAPADTENELVIEEPDF